MEIFIIDDDELLCFILKKQISRYQTLEIWDTAHDGEKALEILAKAGEAERVPPDIILLDLNMPIMDGWEFLEAFTPLKMNLAKQPKICILSSSINPADREKSKIYPEVIEFFTKPLQEEKLELLSRL